MTVVSDTTPIIALSSIGKLDLLKKLFSDIIVPEAVYSEIKAKKSFGYSEIDAPYIKVRSVKGKIYKDLLLTQLDPGEAEVILLAKEVQADVVLIDETLGYRIAKNSGLYVLRTLSLLLKAKEKGFVSQVKPLLDELISNGLWYSDRVYKLFLTKAGET